MRYGGCVEDARQARARKAARMRGRAGPRSRRRGSRKSALVRYSRGRSINSRAAAALTAHRSKWAGLRPAFSVGRKRENRWTCANPTASAVAHRWRLPTAFPGAVPGSTRGVRRHFPNQARCREPTRPSSLGGVTCDPDAHISSWPARKSAAPHTCFSRETSERNAHGEGETSQKEGSLAA